MWTFSPIPITPSALIMNRRSRCAPTRSVSVRAAAPAGLGCSNETANHALAANPAIALWLQPSALVGRVPELGSFGGKSNHYPWMNNVLRAIVDDNRRAVKALV